jgi:hypothetical protein
MHKCSKITPPEAKVAPRQDHDLDSNRLKVLHFYYTQRF